ncbi:ethanolamine ammonia-lyase subunit EutC [Agrobacterium vitis]|uniref:ethanolamine ammonia-lyase subunit EutC n=1 Tax=Agrobacterium vitis TaxID=373 RepID=UPI003D293B36
MTIDTIVEHKVLASATVTRDTLQIPPEATAARLGLGRAGSSVPTKAVLDFTLDHARARDAVHIPLNFDALERDFSTLGVDVLRVNSACPDRQTYLRRPDLGRRLSPASRASLAARMLVCPDVVIIVGDGLSSTAVQNGAAGLLMHLLPMLKAMQLSLGPLVLASQARVALADDIAELLGARMSIILVGERPGLSAANSLGAYLTLAPNRDRTDADRNCVSNIRPGGLDAERAAFKLNWLVERAFREGATGVQLKDESDPGDFPAGRLT